MLIVDSQIHIWQSGKMSAHHRQIPTYSVDDALAEMASAGVDCAVIHPPSSRGEAVNVLAVEAARLHPTSSASSGIAASKVRIARGGT
jgi:predicted TIM-barrel fold metal-dependent hydrolase